MKPAVSMMSVVLENNSSKQNNIKKMVILKSLERSVISELHEQYIVEMRRDVNHKLIELIRHRKKLRNYER